MNDTQPNIDQLYDQRIKFPDPDYLERYKALVGIDDAKEKLSKLLRFMIAPEELRDWAESNYPQSESIINTVLSRPPLIIISGDVGTGKTELATTIGANVSRLSKKPISLYPLSLSTRGEGRVGEMTRLISEAFTMMHDDSKRLSNNDGTTTGGNILLIDEADALAQSRETSQMHHEDRAGVNALIRGIDRLADYRCPAAVIMSTNRLAAIDPAVQRRAAEVFIFTRPNLEQRLHVLSELKCFKFKDSQIKQLAKVGEGDKVTLTYSDLRQRFIPSLVINAAPDHLIEFKETLSQLKALRPTPPFNEDV
jgi:AAA+ superfamily predicted ATPase